MKIIFAIGLGSFIGGVLRYLLSQFVQLKIVSAFPFGTFIVNVIGCFFIGLVFGLAEKGNLTNEWRLFLITGVLGGFTTFSAFSNETVALIREGNLWYASSYAASSIGIGLLATFLGISIAKWI